MKPRPAPVTLERPLQRTLRRVIDGLLLGLVVFTPLAFASVEAWAIGVIECTAIIVFLLWFIRALWSEEPDLAPPAGWTWIGRPLRQAGVLPFVVAFVGLVALQLAPLPPATLRLLSPAASKLYQRTIPYYGAPQGVDFDRVEAWLLEGSGDPSTQEAAAAWSPAADPSLVFTSWRTVSLAPAATRRALGIFLAYLLVFVVIAERSLDPAFRRRLLWTVALTGTLVAMLGLAQETAWRDRVYGRIHLAYGGHPKGPFVNKNHYAGYLEMSVSVLAGLGLALARREGRSESKRARPATPADADQRYVPQIFILCLFLGTVALALWRSGSRGGLAAAAVTFLVLAISWLARGAINGRRWKLLAWGSVLVVCAALSWKVYALTRQTTLEPDLTTEASFGSRLRIWQASMEMLWGFPAVGSGFGTYGYAIPLYQGWGYDRVWIYAHNEYVQLACELGLAGILLFVAGLARFSRRGLLPVLARPLERGGMALGCAAGVLTLLIHSLFDFNLQIPSNGLLFVVLAAVLVGFVPLPPPRPAADAGPPLSRPRRLLASILAAAVGVAAAATLGVSLAARRWQSSATAKYWGGRTVEAKDDLERALRFGGALPDLQADVGFFYLRVLDEWEAAGKRLGLERRQAIDRARVAFCRAINLNPVNTTPWSGLAEVYLAAQSEQLRSSVLDLSELIEAAPGGSRLERLYVAVIRKMMALEPNNHYYHARLADYFWERGSRDLALKAYEEAVRLLPRVDQHLFLSGRGTPPEILQAAIRGAQRALDGKTAQLPEHTVHVNLAGLLELAGDFDSAIRHMERASKLQPRIDSYHLKLGYLCFKAGQFDRSREILTASLQRGVRNAYMYLYLATLARQRGEEETALGYYRKALALQPDNGRMALELAKLYEEMGESRQADRYYEMSMELLPTDVNVLLAVADYYARRGLISRSIPVLRKVVALRPLQDVYRQRLEQLLERSGTVQ